MKLPPGFVPGVGVQRPTAYGGFGEKLLRQLGWKDGEGLGAERQGITSAIKVTKKDDNTGVGGREEFRTKDTEWWLQAYDNVAQSLATTASPSDSSDSDGDEPESPCLAHNRDGTVASGTKEELRLAYELAKDPWGRFGGRNGKLARIRAQEAAVAEAKRQREGGAPADDSAGPPAKKAKKAAAGSKQKKAESAAGAHDGSALQLNKGTTKEKVTKGKKGKKQEPEESQEVAAVKAPVRRVVEVAVAADPDILAAEIKITPRTGWWGANRFISSGCLEGLSQQPRKAERQQFTEDSQADLYNQTQAAKVSGKQGLGVGKGKAVGHDWKGTRVVFEDDSAPEPSAAQNGTAAVEVEGRASGAIKWKRLCKAILQEEPGQKMKLSHLVSRLESRLPPAGRPADIQALLISKVGKSSSFLLKGKSIRLVST